LTDRLGRGLLRGVAARRVAEQRSDCFQHNGNSGPLPVVSRPHADAKRCLNYLHMVGRRL
jgi:hypothetical protein